MVLSAARTRPINSPGPPLLSKSKASPTAPTSDDARRGAAHAAPPSSLRPGFPEAALAAAMVAAAAALESGASLGLSTWSGEQLRASFR